MRSYVASAFLGFLVLSYVTIFLLTQKRKRAQDVCMASLRLAARMFGRKSPREGKLERVERAPHPSHDRSPPRQKGVGRPRLPLGTRRLRSTLYVEVVTPSGWVSEHRAVMERVLQRPLRPSEMVRHRNRLRYDNRPENLTVRDWRHPAWFVCPTCHRRRARMHT